MSFRTTDLGGIAFCEGDPNCDAAESALRTHLDRCVLKRVAAATSVSEAQFGNLGEVLAYLVNRSGQFPLATHAMLGGNCANPLAGNSRTGLDLFWLYFDSSDPSNDRAWVQEVKTTRAVPLPDYLRSLKGDFRKLFSRDKRLSLEVRIGDAAWEFENNPHTRHLADRVRALGGTSAQDTPRVTLLPTGVHDLAADGIPVIEEVRQFLIHDLGWSEQQVSPILIGMIDIAMRLDRVAH